MALDEKNKHKKMHFFDQKDYIHVLGLEIPAQRLFSLKKRGTPESSMNNTALSQDVKMVASTNTIFYLHEDNIEH
jgi:hypothetical protein